ncbi:MAG: CRISPR-associated ring nuclease Csm6 [Desulforhopalus sp.]|nr:CRISPR-associated ring nuclease Csm6 [Desulforhopalus sp.]
MGRRILLALSGLAPQVITETLYCLHQQGRMVDEIHIITTLSGKELLLSQLLGEGGGQYFRFCKEYKIDVGKITFTERNIHIPCGENGKPLTDIFTGEDNEHLLSLTTELTRTLTAERSNIVYFLIAGGRKTMSSCLTLAVQLYGRRQDRLFHILVSPEFESNPGFWYPPVQEKMMKVKTCDGHFCRKSSSDAELYLIPIPFISLRERFASDLLIAPHPPGTLLTSLVKKEDLRLEISLKNATLCYGGVELDMHPARLALYTFFCLAVQKQRWFTALELLEHQQEIAELYQQICVGKVSATSDTGILNLNVENFNSYKSKIKRDLLRAFGESAAEILISSRGKRPDTLYGIEINKKRIAIM